MTMFVYGFAVGAAWLAILLWVRNAFYPEEDR